ncbi:MAG: hypothetical protein AAGA73_11305 [Pseudomonadota bacterium]
MTQLAVWLIAFAMREKGLTLHRTTAFETNAARRARTSIVRCLLKTIGGLHGETG